jgi:hypothetical protein
VLLWIGFMSVAGQIAKDGRTGSCRYKGFVVSTGSDLRPSRMLPSDQYGDVFRLWDEYQPQAETRDVEAL